MTSEITKIFNGKIRLYQSKKGYRFSIDALILADFIKVKEDESVCDLGAGCGVLPIILSKNFKADKVVGVEIQKKLFELAKKNFKLNGCDAEVLNLDLRKYKPTGKFDIVVSNPPYRKENSGKINPSDEKAIARHEIKCTLDDLLSSASRLLKLKGKFYFIYVPERIGEVMQKLSKYNLAAKEIRFVHSKMNKDAELVLVKAMKGVNEGLKVLPPLVIYKDGQEYTEEAGRIICL